jgi:hypothetical protein
MTRLRMRDCWTFKPKEIPSNKKYLFECKDSTSPTGTSLLVKVAATHAGIINSNHRFYRPDRMQDAAHQWIPEEGKGYPKPVLFEHNKQGDVLGRVRTARYIDESYKWTNDFPTVKDSVFYKVGDKKIDLFKSVDWIVDNLMNIPDYSGLGYIELGLNVTNPEAISKVLRDEFLTVSVGFQTNSAICSACHTDWAADDKCDHRPGMTDDESGKKIFLICGDFKYEELSFVNFPADPFAGKIAKDALKDSLNRKFFMGLSHDKQQAYVAAAGMSMSDAVMDYDIQPVEDTVAIVHDLTKTDSQNAFEAEMKDDKLVAIRALELKQNLQDWKPETEGDKTKRRSLMSTLNAKIKKNNWVGVDAAATTETDKEIQAAITEDTSAEATTDTGIDWSKEQLSAEDTEFFNDEEGLYAELVIELDAAKKAGELGDISDAQLADAKLSTEARKKLGGSTFCGPNRSFPVPDCAHVTAARRLIGRAKVSDGTKSKILSCVSRKASSLGCGGKTDSAPQLAEKTDTSKVSDEFHDFLKTLDIKDGHATEALTHYASLDKCYKGSDAEVRGSMRNVHYNVGQRWDAESSLEWAKKYLKEQDKDSVIISSKDLADKEEAVNTLTDEISKLNNELTVAKNTSTEMLKGIKKSLATQIVIYKSLAGHADYKDLDKTKLQSKVEELSKRHVTSLRDAVADIMSELKWIEPVSTQPTDKVTEPGKSVADNVHVGQPVVDAVDSASETEAETLKKQQMANAILRDKLNSMTARERNIYLADLAYNIAKPAKK